MRKFIIVSIVSIVFLAGQQALAATGESWFASLWESFNEDERTAYALGAYDGISITCHAQSKNKKEFEECLKDFGLDGPPEELFKLYDRAYVKHEFPHVPPSMLLVIWADRHNKDLESQLRRLEEKMKEAQKSGKGFLFTK